MGKYDLVFNGCSITGWWWSSEDPCSAKFVCHNALGREFELPGRQMCNPWKKSRQTRVFPWPSSPCTVLVPLNFITCDYVDWVRLIVITLLLFGLSQNAVLRLAEFSETISYISTEVRSQLRSNEWRWKGRRNKEEEEDRSAWVRFFSLPFSSNINRDRITSMPMLGS